MPTLKERVGRHDREIVAIRKLIHTGMKLIVRNEEQRLALRKELRELAAAQKETDRALKRFIQSMDRGNGNGHSRRPVQ